MPGAMFATVQGSMELAEFAPVQRRSTEEKNMGVQQGSTTTGEPRTGGSTEEWMSTRQACNPSSGPTPPPSLFLQFIFPIFPGNCFSLHTHINSSSNLHTHKLHKTAKTNISQSTFLHLIQYPECVQILKRKNTSIVMRSFFLQIIPHICHF